MTVTNLVTVGEPSGNDWFEKEGVIGIVGSTLGVSGRSCGMMGDSFWGEPGMILGVAGSIPGEVFNKNNFLDVSCWNFNLKSFSLERLRYADLVFSRFLEEESIENL